MGSRQKAQKVKQADLSGENLNEQEEFANSEVNNDDSQKDRDSLLTLMGADRLKSNDALNQFLNDFEI
jgi:hypothetical protein